MFTYFCRCIQLITNLLKTMDYSDLCTTASSCNHKKVHRGYMTLGFT